jgi:hypothetical protein
MKIRFTHIVGSLAAGVVLFHAITFAQEARVRDPFEGTWRWTFIMPDGAEVKPALKIKRDSQAFIGTTRFRAGDWSPVANMVVQGDELKFDVVRERDGNASSRNTVASASGDGDQGQDHFELDGPEREATIGRRSTWMKSMAPGAGP